LLETATELYKGGRNDSELEEISSSHCSQHAACKSAPGNNQKMIMPLEDD
jgi:hypothetical protein